jgi:hypothetical protein
MNWFRTRFCIQAASVLSHRSTALPLHQYTRTAEHENQEVAAYCRRRSGSAWGVFVQLVHDNDKALEDSASHLASSTLPTGQRDTAESLVIVRAVVRTPSTDRLYECYGTRRAPPGNGYALDIGNTIRLVLAGSTSQTSDATTNFTIWPAPAVRSGI